jgi:hypothetical protein
MLDIVGGLIACLWRREDRRQCREIGRGDHAEWAGCRTHDDAGLVAVVMAADLLVGYDL